MHCVKKIRDDVFWVGSSDRRLALFENVSQSLVAFLIIHI